MRQLWKEIICQNCIFQERGQERIHSANMIKEALTFYRIKKQWFGDGATPVDSQTAQARADVCLKCPYNQPMPIWELFAGSVAFAVKQQLRLKSEMKLRVNGEEDLHVCERCLCILSLKPFVPLQHILDSSDTSNLPEWCWITKEKQNLQHDHKNSGVQKQ